MPDLEAGVFRTAAFASREARLPDWSGFPLSQGVIGRAFREKATQLVDDVTRDPDYRPWAAFTKSEVAIPILSGDEVVAILDIEGDVVRAFDQGQVITLETLADGLGIILRNAELFKALEETNARLVELDRTKSELVHIVAHDFRAPLSTILGYAELLEWKPEAPVNERKERAGAIVRAATHMAGLMDKTLTTARLETGHMSFDFGLVDLAELAREAGKRFSGDERHPLVLEVPDYPLPSWADTGRVADVLDNLLANAVKYSPRGGTVKLRVERGRETAVFSVSDQGIGIAPKDRDRLFRPFSRVRDAETAEIDGFGLGLYICERVARAHGGKLDVRERARRRLDLPVRAAPLRRRRPGPAPPGARGHPGREDAKGSAAGGRRPGLRDPRDHGRSGCARGGDPARAIRRRPRPGVASPRRPRDRRPARDLRGDPGDSHRGPRGAGGPGSGGTTFQGLFAQAGGSGAVGGVPARGAGAAPG